MVVMVISELKLNSKLKILLETDSRKVTLSEVRPLNSSSTAIQVHSLHSRSCIYKSCECTPIVSFQKGHAREVLRSLLYIKGVIGLCTTNPPERSSGETIVYILCRLYVRYRQQQQQQLQLQQEQ